MEEKKLFDLELVKEIYEAEMLVNTACPSAAGDYSGSLPVSGGLHLAAICEHSIWTILMVSEQVTWLLSCLCYYCLSFSRYVSLLQIIN